MTERNITREEIESLWERSIAPGMTIEMSIKPPSDEPEAAAPAAEKGATDLSSSLTVTDRIEVREQSVADAGKVKPPPQYELLDVLGEGGMGTVFRARQTSVDRQIALKMLRPDAAEKKRDRDRFLSEAVATADLDHPNIIPVHDLGTNESGQLFYAMKEVRGTPWEQVLDGKPLQENLSILLRVADAVAFAHSRGIIHRDLNPDNVMLGDYGEVMLTDWGLAVSVTDEGKAARLEEGHTVGGTPSYMAPELAAGEVAKIGPCSDVYLLGAILFRVVTGRSPHSGAAVMECLRNAANNVISLPEEEETGKTHEQELLDIARKAMSTEPGERHSDVKTFQADVRAYLDHAESIVLADSAAADLDKSGQSKNYRDYTRAVSGYEQALNLWAENERALSGLKDAQLAYANCAFDRGDFDLADSLLDEGVAAHRSLAKRIEAARRERDAHVKRVKTFKTVAAVSAASVLALGVGAFLWIQRAELKTMKAREEARELAKQRLESWLPVCEFDFAKDKELDERFETLRCVDVGASNREVMPAPDSVSIGQGELIVHGKVRWIGGIAVLRWKEDVGEDLRVEVTVPGDQFFILSVAGDSLNSYRAVFDLYRASVRPVVELDTIAEIEQRMFARSRGRTDETAKTHVAVLEKSGQTIRVKLDGVTHIEYWDPFPFRGEQHRTFSLGAWWADARFRSLRVSRRRSPEVVSALEIGRERMRLRRFAEAERFFREKCSTHADTDMGMEAKFLLGLALEHQARGQEALALYEELVDLAPGRVPQQLRLAALNQAAHMLVESKEFEKACDKAAQAFRLNPSAPAPDTVYNRILAHARKATEQERDRLLALTTRLPVEKWELNGLGLTNLPSFAGSTVTSLRITDHKITDLSPLRGSSITHLDCGGNDIEDLTPLKGLQLSSLHFKGNKVADLSPLRGKQLERLAFGGNKISDLSPLKGMPLLGLGCRANEIADLTPLEGMPLESLDLDKNRVSDLSPLKGMPLQFLQFVDNEIGDLAPLEGMPLKQLEFAWNRVSDLSPLEGANLEELNCARNAITNLAPLRDMKLRELVCDNNRISDLGPLQGMPLRLLSCFDNPIPDLTPLKGRPLRRINAADTLIHDLSPLEGMSLLSFECNNSLVTNLAPLRGMPLDHIDFSFNRVSDLSPLKDAPLKRIECRHNPIANLLPLKGMTTLESLEATEIGRSDISALEGLSLVWLEYDSNGVSNLSPLAGMPLRVVDLARNNVSDLGPLKGMPLERLFLSENPVSDISTLKGMRLKKLFLDRTQVTDLSPLEGMQLESLSIAATPVSDLAVLNSMQVTNFTCGYTQVKDLSPLEGMSLKGLGIAGIPLSPENARIVLSLELKDIGLDLSTPGALDLVRRMPTLEAVNGQRVEHVLKVGDDVLRAARREDADLQKHAERSGQFLWLAIPYAMPYDEAVRFCEAQGGYLACPSTESKRAALALYVRSVREHGNTRMPVGGFMDPSDGTWQWRSGEPWDPDQWSSPWHRQQPPDAESATFFVWDDGTAFAPEAPAVRSRFVIEWKEEE